MSNIRPGSGVLIRVANLDQQRIFYRELLMLGNPLVDSAFWVEFAAPDGTRIILEKSAIFCTIFCKYRAKVAAITKN